MIQPVGWNRGSFVGMLVAVAALLIVGGTASGTTPPSIPGLPHIPGVKLPPPDEKAVFDVIVEGKATDHYTSQLSGLTSICIAKEDSTVDETDTYLRGKDVKLEFDRYGKTIIVKRDRSGVLGDTTLALKATVHRTAKGGTKYEPYTKLPCNVASTDISKNADCGKSIPVPNAADLLSWSSNQVSLKLTRKTVLKIGGDTCGDDSQTGITDALLFGWPNLDPLSKAALPRKWIFDSRMRTIVVHLRASDVGPTVITRHVTFGMLKGTVTDRGTNTATVRFIRKSS